MEQDDKEDDFVSNEQFYEGKHYIGQGMPDSEETSGKVHKSSDNQLKNLNSINNEPVKLGIDSYLTPAREHEEFDQEIVIGCDVSVTKENESERRSMGSPLSNADSIDYSLSPGSLNTYGTSDNFASQLRESPMETSMELQALRNTESYSPLSNPSESQNYLISSDYETNSPALDMSRAYFCVVSPINDTRTMQSRICSASSEDNVFQVSQSSLVSKKSCERVHDIEKSRNNSNVCTEDTETVVNDSVSQHQSQSSLELFEQSTLEDKTDLPSHDSVKKAEDLTPDKNKPSMIKNIGETHLHESSTPCNTLIVNQKLIEQIVCTDRQISMLGDCHSNNSDLCGNSVMIKLQGNKSIWDNLPVSTRLPHNTLQTSLSSANNTLISKSTTIHSLDNALSSSQPYLQVALVNDLDSTTPVELIPTDQILGSVMPDMYICQWEACTSHFISIDDLVKHISNIHITAENKYNFICLWKGCIRQGKPFDARYKMVIHMRTHTGEKPHVCPVQDCGASFARLENLKIHRRSHTGEKPYVCQVPGCGRSFANSSDRFKHKRTHDMKKPFKCIVSGCGKCYTDPSSLRKHRKRHQVDKLKEFEDNVYVCDKVSVHAHSMV